MKEEKIDTAGDKNEKPSLGEYFQFGELTGYFFRKKDPNRKTNFSLRMMHGVNKISIIMFLVAIIVLIVRRLLA
ncbi:MAG: DUF6728 family protein [Cyclobacteriaceae bacterium]